MAVQATRAVLAGAGFWASHAHLPALLAQDSMEVIGVADPALDRAQHLASAHGIPRATISLDELLLERPDLVVVATPTETHVPLTVAALKAGAAVLCEKPLANTVEGAEGLAELAEHLGVLASVGYSFRYGPALQALKRDILAGSLGDLWLLEMFEYNAQFHPARHNSLNWKGDPALARAGALLEYGAHLIDLAGWLAGSIEAVHGSLTRVLPEARLDDIATLQVRFRAPAIGVLVAGWVLSGSVPGIKVRFHGSEGLAEVEMSQTVPGGQAYRRATLDGVMTEQPLESLPDPVWGYAARHISDLVARLRGEPSPFPHTMPTMRDGATVQHVLEAALAATHPGPAMPATAGFSR